MRLQLKLELKGIEPDTEGEMEANTKAADEGPRSLVSE